MDFMLAFMFGRMVTGVVAHKLINSRQKCIVMCFDI